MKKRKAVAERLLDRLKEHPELSQFVADDAKPVRVHSKIIADSWRLDDHRVYVASIDTNRKWPRIPPTKRN